MTSSILERNNVNVLGEGEQALIFAHGFGSDQSAWRHQVEAFAPKYRIVLFDHVGAGKSDFNAYSPHRYSSLYSYAEDLLDLCDQLKLNKPILVGHSVSGMIGLLASLVESNRFSKLIFISASPRYLNDRGYVGGFERTDLDNLYAAMSANYYSWASGFAPLIMGHPDRPELAQEFARTLTAIRPDIAQAVARVIFESDHRQDLLRLQVPTLILQPTNDVAVPSDVGQYMADKIKHNQYTPIATEGHHPHLSTPDIVTKAIASWIGV